LNNISLSVKPGERLAICGPSGSGKSSLILSLLQIIDIQQGQILIDDLDLSGMHCDDVRSCLNVIPQDPFFMPGTIRFNMDPHQAANDEDIEHAIRKVGLWDRVNADGGLRTELSASNWSMGERQLFSLARALVSKSPILILDEATSRSVFSFYLLALHLPLQLPVIDFYNSVDHKTETTMLEVIEREFKHRTVISVVHRLHFIHSFDRVAFLRHGQLVECDTPKALLERPSELKQLYDSSEKSD
jgi:ATP-binding cassette subfamily C (CFTR/MRP) protein 1